MDTWRETNTYSVVARDPVSGELGVAVQSHYFAVGPVAPWVEAGVGAVAAQAYDGAEFGPLVLEVLRSGLSAGATLAGMLETDAFRDFRQVAIVDAAGNVAVHTGSRCTPAAGHAVGDNFSVQANVMVDESVWEGMRRGYEESKGDLAHRLMAALEGGQRAGGDIRGQQSAALLVVSGARPERPWLGRLIDIRADDHPRPLEEMWRLLRLHRAHDLLHRAKASLMKRRPEDALAMLTAALDTAPDQVEIRFYQALALLELGRDAQAEDGFRSVFREGTQWARLLPRLVDRGLMARAVPAIPRIVALGSE